jgi:hypothetical protein
MELDHIAVSGETLAEAKSKVEDALGVALQTGGEHDVFFTHNALLALNDGLYLEAIAINPSAPVPTRPRWFDLDRFEGKPRLTNWICRCDDLDRALAELPDGFGTPVSLQRGDLRWRMAVPADGVLPFDNSAPALIEWQTKTHPASRLQPSGISLKRLIIGHPEANILRDTLSGKLDDDRVIFEAGRPGMRAEFDTPHGQRALAA